MNVNYKIILIASLIFFLVSCRTERWRVRLVRLVRLMRLVGGRSCASVSWTRPVLVSGAPHPQQQQQQLQQHPERAC